MKIAVLGFYYHQNLGDQFFIEAFKSIFPKFSFTFVQKLDIATIKKSDAIFIGGGSFLNNDPEIEDLELLKTKPIFYIGVGAETHISVLHTELLKLAKLIVIRNSDAINKIKQLNHNVKFLPDLVYAIPHQITKKPVSKSVLILPNISVIPAWNDPIWKQSAWLHFKSEFAQFLDVLIENNFNINFLSMSMNDQLSDHAAELEITNMMSYRDNYHITYNSDKFEDILNIISNYSFIISQRFHGIILAEILQIPYLAIYHHDKLKSNTQENGKFLSYYGIYKQKLLDEFNLLSNVKFDNNLSINPNLFKDLNQEVETLINGL